MGKNFEALIYACPEWLHIILLLTQISWFLTNEITEKQSKYRSCNLRSVQIYHNFLPPIALTKTTSAMVQKNTIWLNFMKSLRSIWKRKFFLKNSRNVDFWRHFNDVAKIKMPLFPCPPLQSFLDLAHSFILLSEL